MNQDCEAVVYKNKHDYLTSLSNSSALIDLLKKGEKINLMLLNINHFRNINDAYGFDIGDEVLIGVAKLLKMVTPHDTSIFKLDADEFAIVQEGEKSKEELAESAECILSFFTQMEIPLECNIEMKVTLNLGIATGSGTSLLTKSKLALRESKEYKRGSYRFFNSHSKFVLQQQDNIYWTQKIKGAIDSGNIVPYYQPIHNNITKKIQKYECLARIEDDGLIIAPSRFMPSAKVTGMLPFITKTMIEQSFKHFSAQDIEFSINITSDDFYLDYLENYLLKYALKYDIKPTNVILEILEDITSLNQSTILEQLDSLRRKGFKIAIDDFGSESSNLSRLLEFSPDYIKIDGSFIKNILEDEKSLIIVEAIVLIAKRSKIKIIAEYVHNKEIQDKVAELGIEYSQGYYFSEARRDTH